MADMLIFFIVPIRTPLLSTRVQLHLQAPASNGLTGMRSSFQTMKNHFSSLRLRPPAVSVRHIRVAGGSV